jgi:hypothetical protein
MHYIRVKDKIRAIPKRGRTPTINNPQGALVLGGTVIGVGETKPVTPIVFYAYRKTIDTLRKQGMIEIVSELKSEPVVNKAKENPVEVPVVDIPVVEDAVPEIFEETAEVSLDAMTSKQLKELCADKGIEVSKGMTKTQVLEVLHEAGIF